MNNYNKTVLGIVVSLGLVSGSVQASPFREFGRKWTARGAAVGYWGMLALPTSFGLYGLGIQKDIDKTLDLVDENNHHYIPDLKEYNPKRYASIRAGLQKEGLGDLDNCRVKVLTPGAIDRMQNSQAIPAMHIAIFKMISGTPISSPSSIILQDGSRDVDNHNITDLSDEGLAGIISHEKKHIEANHTYKKVATLTTAPFAIHATSKAMYQKMTGKKENTGRYPTVGRSLLRIPRAGLILGATILLGQSLSRALEKEADSNMKNSPELARAVAVYLNRYVEPGDTQEGNQGLRQLLLTHPHALERIAYLNRWAEQAEAKQKKA